MCCWWFRQYSTLHFYFVFWITFCFLTISLNNLYSQLIVDDLSYNKTQVFYQRATLVKEICEKYNLTQEKISKNTLEQNVLLNLEHKVDMCRNFINFKAQ